MPGCDRKGKPVARRGRKAYEPLKEVAELPNRLERVMNSAEKPHRNANVSVSSVLRRSPVFRISKPFLSKFITASRARPRMGPPRVGAQRGLEKCSQGDVTAARDGPKQGPGEAQTPPGGGAGDTGAPGAAKGPFG